MTLLQQELRPAFVTTREALAGVLDRLQYLIADLEVNPPAPVYQPGDGYVVAWAPGGQEWLDLSQAQERLASHAHARVDPLSSDRMRAAADALAGQLVTSITVAFRLKEAAE